MNRIVRALMALALALVAHPLAAQTNWPDKPVRLVVGFTAGSATDVTARMFAQLKPLNERKLSADQVIGRIRRKTAQIPGAALYLQSVQDLSVGGRSSAHGGRVWNIVSDRNAAKSAALTIVQ